jgi:dTDP-4-dehydrorhamnose 3,5-epimerase
LKIQETKFKNLFVIETEPVRDNRGFFVRVWDENIFKKNGLSHTFVQNSISHNLKKGTLRGMHYQVKPYEEAKIVNCIRGKIFDVVIDLRSNSKTYLEKFEIELDSTENKSLFIPEGFAHGFQTMDDNTDVYYQISQFFKSEFGRGILWNDPIFNINWPISDPILSQKDTLYNAFKT